MDPTAPIVPALTFDSTRIRDNQIALKDQYPDFAFVWRQLWIDLAKVVPANTLLSRYENGIGPLPFKSGKTRDDTIYCLQASITPTETEESAIFPDCKYILEKPSSPIVKNADPNDSETNISERGFVWWGLEKQKKKTTKKSQKDFKISYPVLFREISANILTKQFFVERSWEYIFEVEFARSGVNISIKKGNSLSAAERASLEAARMKIVDSNDYFLATKGGTIVSAVMGKDWNTSLEATFLSIVPSNKYLYGPAVETITRKEQTLDEEGNPVKDKQGKVKEKTITELVGINAQGLPFRSTVIFNGSHSAPVLDEFKTVPEFYPLVKAVNNAYYFEDAFGPMRSFVQLFAMVHVANSERNYTGLISKLRQTQVQSAQATKIFIPDLAQLAETLEILGFSRAFNSQSLFLDRPQLKDTPFNRAVVATIQRSEEEDPLYGEGPYKIVHTPTGFGLNPRPTEFRLAGEIVKAAIQTEAQCAKLNEVFENLDILEATDERVNLSKYIGLSNPLKPNRNLRVFLPFLCARVMPTAEEFLGAYALLKCSTLYQENFPQDVPLPGQALGGGQLEDDFYELEGGSTFGSVVGSTVETKSQLTHLEDSRVLDKIPHNTLWDTNQQAQQLSMIKDM